MRKGHVLSWKQIRNYKGKLFKFVEVSENNSQQLEPSSKMVCKLNSSFSRTLSLHGNDLLVNHLFLASDQSCLQINVKHNPP